MERISCLCGRIATVRQKTSPRTSYATAGSASKNIYIFGELDDVDITAFSTELTLTGEFESVQHLLYNTSSKSSFDFLHGHVVIFLNPNQENMRTLTNLVIMGKSNVGFGIFSSHHIPKQSTIDEIDRTWLTVKEECCGVDNLIIFYRNKNVAGEAKGVDNVDLIGSNGQPSVQSRSQFRFLWNEASAVEGKHRVLQRIAEKGKSNDSYKPLTPHWDSIIKNVLMLEGDDYAVYSSLRHEYMGTSLDDDLEIKLSPASSILGTKETKYEESQQLDGRADFMVKRTQECIPSFLHGRVRTLLDYGCAEGAITAALCRQLQVPADRAFGADVRSIASKGFTYIQIPAEMDRAPRIGEILPSLRDGCIDLITSAMVFHHVKYIKETLLELRRVVSPQGALVIREHHCTSAHDGAFLDITHGLYSLAWSSPVEWPAFLQEYKAWYRSQEEWTTLIEKAGFRRHSDSSQAERLYSAKSPRRLSDSKFSNLVKAYYAVYVPDPKFVVPKPQPGPSPHQRQQQEQQQQQHHREVQSESAQAGINTTSAVLSEADWSVDTATAASAVGGSISKKRMRDDEQTQTRTQGKTVEAVGVGPASAPLGHHPAAYELHESSKYRGHYYIRDSAGNPKWVTTTYFSSGDLGSVAAVEGSVTAALGSFKHPATGETCVIAKIHHATS